MPARYSANERRTGSLVAARCGGSRLQNGSGSGEYAGGALVGNFLFGLEPVLHSFMALAAKRDLSRNRIDYCNFAYSTLACFRMGMSGSTSFQSVRELIRCLCFGDVALQGGSLMSIQWDSK